MSKNKKQSNKQNNFPYSNETKQLKDEFKRMIDEMSDEEFMNFSFAFIGFLEDMSDDSIEEMWADDEGWEDEAEQFYNNSNNNKNEINKDLPF